MEKQVVFVSPNGIKIIVNKDSDPRNVQLFANAKIVKPEGK